MNNCSLCLVLLVAAAVAHAAVEDVAKSSANDIGGHDFQEDVHLTENEADAKLIDLDDDYDGSSGDYYDDDDDYYDDEEDYDDDYEDEDDPEWASGDYYDDEDLLEDDDDDIEDEDIHFDEDKVDDILYEYHAEDYEGDDYDFSKEVEQNIVYQPPQVQIRDHGNNKPDDATVTVSEHEPSPSSSRNLLVSVFVASGLASFALFTLAFVMCFCNRRSRDGSAASAAKQKSQQLPFVIHHSSSSSPLNSSIIKPQAAGGKYQPVATQENRSNHSIENANSVLKQQNTQQLEEKLLLP